MSSFFRDALRYSRLWIFDWLRRPVSKWSRSKRMELFVETVKPRPHERVLDLGGHPSTWAQVKIPLSVTILNLPDAMSALPPTTGDVSHHAIRHVEGDACNVRDFVPGDFDIVHSNSVIEHVGPADNQQQFARQVLKFGVRYWIQTPSKWFPIEPHCGMPFWWFYSESLRQRLIERWYPKLPAWAEMVADTRVLEKRELSNLFPGCNVHTERVLGIPKSYVAWSNTGADRQNDSIP